MLLMDDLIKKDIDSIALSFHGNNNIATIAGGDVYLNTTIKKVTRYKHVQKPDEITAEQASELQDLVNQIVLLEKKTKAKHKGHAAVWNTLKRKFKVGYYREMKTDLFPEAEAYLMKWIGQLKRGLKSTDRTQWKNERYKAIFSAAKNQMGWDKQEVDNFIYSMFEKDSIRDLTNKELEKLYQKIMSIKQKI